MLHKHGFAGRERLVLAVAVVCFGPGRGKRTNTITNASVYHVYKYFEKGSAKSKYRGPPKLTLKTAEATERTVRRIIAEMSEISGPAFASPPKRCQVKEEYNTA